MVHTTDHTQLILLVLYNSPTATSGQRYGLSRASRDRPTRTEQEIAGLPEPSGPNARARARERPDRRHRMLQAAADAAATNSIDRRSAHRGGRLPETAAGSGLPRGSARVVRQLGGMGTRSWSRRERQMACCKALRADAGNKREETGREGGAGVARTSREISPA